MSVVAKCEFREKTQAETVIALRSNVETRLQLLVSNEKRALEVEKVPRDRQTATATTKIGMQKVVRTLTVHFWTKSKSREEEREEWRIITTH